MTMFSRVMYCPECHKHHYPQEGQIYLVYRTDHKDFAVLRSNRNGIFGYTPHIIRLVKIQDTLVHYEYACGMYPCSDIWKKRVLNKNTRHPFYEDFYYVKHWHYGVTTIDNWNAWQKFKRTGYEI